MGRKKEKEWSGWGDGEGADRQGTAPATSPTCDPFTEGPPRSPKPRGAGAGPLDPDTTVYMQDPDDDGSCMGVRIWGFAELLVRQATQLILASRRCGAEPLMDLDAAERRHVELLYRFVEQVVKNLLENITHLKEAPPAAEAPEALPVGDDSVGAVRTGRPGGGARSGAVPPGRPSDSLDDSASLCATDKPEKTRSTLTNALSGFFCFSCSTGIHK
ncbi:hypothetical protein COCON_G00210160 [Conger conger]|uniref:Uncharacterized protein n=1 Tax=Conger conger TaxID=82655 RepID=A0A9Q1D0C6_CONCO|nr:hypothetical protein COCON_G00210160 [Conger conger]